jgi:hypothetical protein
MYARRIYLIQMLLRKLRTVKHFINLKNLAQGAVVPACNPSYVGSRNQENCS